MIMPTIVVVVMMTMTTTTTTMMMMITTSTVTMIMIKIMLMTMMTMTTTTTTMTTTMMMTTMMMIVQMMMMSSLFQPLRLGVRSILSYVQRRSGERLRLQLYLADGHHGPRSLRGCLPSPARPRLHQPPSDAGLHLRRLRRFHPHQHPAVHALPSPAVLLREPRRRRELDRSAGGHRLPLRLLPPEPRIALREQNLRFLLQPGVVYPGDNYSTDRLDRL